MIIAEHCKARITKPFGDNSADAYALSHDDFAW